ncbi:hypothetical protein HWV23_05910 [Natronomonas halophila]|uniref:hypothetical protein n=1 Tax=Natronomonas halophila TaxID=2747817 RepID=UPI0015B6AD33|nr:hypothetical protein [Natronomonas halophila]QLD85280.1 hypothetical protein HWV23_05910 [Natronomonas halophila]
MRELLVAALELGGYLLGTVVFAVVGLFAELNSLSYLSAGNHLFAGWLVVIGALALYAAYSVGTEKVLPRLRELTA